MGIPKQCRSETLIANCHGCEWELEEAYRQQELGLCVATCRDWPSSENIGHKGHYAFLIVNDKGKIMMW